MELTFIKEKDTKNTGRFAEQVAEGEPTVIGTLYVQKHFCKGATELKVTIEVVK